MHPTDKLLRLRDVMDRTGLGRSTIYRKIGAAAFPQPVSVGGASVRWRESDVRQWMAALAPRTDVRPPSSPAADAR
jgi:prophage regulatory protein